MATLRVSLGLALIVVGVIGSGCDGCGRVPEVVDGGVTVDLVSARDLSVGDGGQPIAVGLTMSGCGALTVVDGRPRCVGIAPLAVTLVPLDSAGVNTWIWTLPGAMPSTSKATTPLVTWAVPGSYPVKLVVGGPGGTASAEGQVDVTPSPTGGACSSDQQCAASYQCICGSSGDGGAGCDGALSIGLCTRGCDGALCGIGEACADLGRTGTGTTQATPAWRQPLCLPTCNGPGDCRPGFVCRQLPTLATGGHSGDAFTWKGVCFAPLLGDVGDGCVDAFDELAPAGCITGECAALGARGLCTHACGSDGACPPATVCATFKGEPGSVCIPRCDGSHPCVDPLLECQVADAAGALGFTVSKLEPMTSTFCGPRRCQQDGQCQPAGSCDHPDGGTGFCH